MAMADDLDRIDDRIQRQQMEALRLLNEANLLVLRAAEEIKSIGHIDREVEGESE
jgi:hypothetical protein